jgi:hypothetical protein
LAEIELNGSDPDDSEPPTPLRCCTCCGWAACTCWRHRVWPWVVLATLVGLGLLLAAFAHSAEAPPEQSTPAPAAAAVSAFLAWIRSPCLRHCVHGASIIGAAAARGLLARRARAHAGGLRLRALGGRGDGRRAAPSSVRGGWLGPAGRGRGVSRPFPSWDRSILTEIYLCHACSCHEVSRAETAGQTGGRGGALTLHALLPRWRAPAAAAGGGRRRPAGRLGLGRAGRAAAGLRNLCGGPLLVSLPVAAPPRGGGECFPRVD